jgi:esterase
MKLNYRISGSGKPLVILHGLFGYSDNWQTHAKRLSSYFQVILVDQRNHGHSDWSDDFSYDLMAQDLKELLDDEKLDKILLLGHSMGGKTSIRFAQLYPEMVEKLIVVDIGVKQYPSHHDTILDGLKAVTQTSLTSRAEAESAMSQHIDSIGVRQFLLKNLYWKEKEKLGWRMNIPVLEKSMPIILGKLPEDMISISTLFVRGGMSDYIRDEDLEDLEEQFIDMELKTIDGAGHWVHAERPDEFMDLVLNFLLR